MVKRGPDSRKIEENFLFFYEEKVDEKDGMKRDTRRVALIPL